MNHAKWRIWSSKMRKKKKVDYESRKEEEK